MMLLMYLVAIVPLQIEAPPGNPWLFWTSTIVLPAVFAVVPAASVASLLRSSIVDCVLIFLAPTILSSLALFLFVPLVSMSIGDAAMANPILYAWLLLAAVASLVFIASFRLTRRLLHYLNLD